MHVSAAAIRPADTNDRRLCCPVRPYTHVHASQGCQLTHGLPIFRVSSWKVCAGARRVRFRVCPDSLRDPTWMRECSYLCRDRDELILNAPQVEKSGEFGIAGLPVQSCLREHRFCGAQGELWSRSDVLCVNHEERAPGRDGSEQERRGRAAATESRRIRRDEPKDAERRRQP
eukprot:scaffold3575_cov254-Pinguiococcus_pyrenoidosus.AAC.8